MKTKTIFILCLLLGFGVTQLSAQKGRTTHEEEVWPGYYMPVYCNGTMVDYLNGTVHSTILSHYNKDGTWAWNNYQSFGEAVSTSYEEGDLKIIGTGEVFSVNENGFKADSWPLVTVNFNLIGNKGRHYLGTYSYNYETFEMTFIKCICN